MGKDLLLFDNCLVGACNMGCKYCRDRSNSKIREMIKRSDAATDLKKVEDDLRRISSLVSANLSIPIVKISGYGESFLLPNIMETLKILSESYEKVQIMTNASLLNEDKIRGLSNIRGINICVSLDGHTAELNASRTRDNRLIRKILRNIELLRRYKIPVEINSVLTKHNISGFVGFIRYLSERYDGLVCYPFPVRRVDDLSTSGRPSAQMLRPLVDSYKRFSHILPHREYIKRLISFISNGKRQNKCYAGYAILGIDPDGYIPVCACNIKQVVGNVFKEESILALNKRMAHPVFYKFLLRELSFKDCRRCYTPYEMISLYLDGTIALEEISRLDLFSGERARKALKAIRDRLKSAEEGGEGDEREYGRAQKS